MGRVRVTVVLMATCLASSGASWASGERVLVSVPLDLTGLDAPEVSDAGKLLNDLGRSPYWSLHAHDDGGRSASLRVLSSGWSGRESWFLPDWVAQGAPAPAQGAMAVGNSGLRRDGVVSLDVSVVTEAPEGATHAWGQPVVLPISSRYPKQGLDGNAASVLVLPLVEGAWLRVREQGSDSSRAATRAAVELVQGELERVSALPEDYRAREVYSEVFTALGVSSAPHALRYPGMQDRDTLGVVLEVPAVGALEGLQVHVFDEEVCHGECTRDFRQTQKAELFGSPPPGDWVLSLMTDTGVFLDAAGSARYGTFSGSEAFEAEIRWSNGKGEAVWTTKGPFKGWER